MTTRYPRKPIRRWTPSYDVAPTAISNRLGNAIWDVLMTGKTTLEAGGLIADIDFTTPPVDKAANRPIWAELDDPNGRRVLTDEELEALKEFGFIPWCKIETPMSKWLWNEPETEGEEFVRRRGEFRTGGPLTTPIVQVDRGEEFIPIVRQHIAAGGGFDTETLADAVSRGLKALRSHAYTVGPLVDVTITYKAITRTNAQAVICDARESGQRLGITLPLVTRTGVP